MPQTLDTTFVRNQFPAFSNESLHGWAFFENAGGSYACEPVVRRLGEFYEQTKVQPYGFYPASRTGGEQMDEAYCRLAPLMGVAEQELHLGPSTSQNTYVLANAFREILEPGDEVIVTEQNHEANRGVWCRLEQSGSVVKPWPVDPQSGHLDVAMLDELLTSRTRVVAVPHCSNIVAEVNPIAEIAEKCHAVGARVIVDGVSYAPHGFPDIGAMGADVYLFSLYKTFGPHLGAMTVRQDLLEQLEPQCHYFNAESPRKRMLPAGPDHAQIAAAVGIADYFDAVATHHADGNLPAAKVGSLVHQLFTEHETRLLAPLLEWLADREDVRVLGPLDATCRAPTVSIVPLQKDPQQVMATLEQNRIMASLAHFYAPRLLEAMGVDPNPGVVRLSFVHYTTSDEIEQLIAALSHAL